jgi:hypothetical protein
VQEGDRSWEKIKKWHELLQAGVDKAIFATLLPAITKDIRTNYHYEEGGGKDTKIPESEYDHLEAADMEMIFLSIQRRANGGAIHTATDENEALVIKELERVTWQKKCPEPKPWCVRISVCVCLTACSFAFRVLRDAHVAMSGCIAPR